MLLRDVDVGDGDGELRIVLECQSNDGMAPENDDVSSTPIDAAKEDMLEGGLEAKKDWATGGEEGGHDDVRRHDASTTTTKESVFEKMILEGGKELQGKRVV